MSHKKLARNKIALNVTALEREDGYFVTVQEFPELSGHCTDKRNIARTAREAVALFESVAMPYLVVAKVEIVSA